MTGPTAILAEDEPLLRRDIRHGLEALWPELSIIAEAEDGAEAVEAIDRNLPTVVFLDIQMPGVNGLDVANHISGRAHVVFISAFDRHALAAFERGAVDYILKPLSLSRLQVTVDRLKQRLAAPPENLDSLLTLLRTHSGERPKYLKWLSVPSGSDLRIVTTFEVCYFRADNKYTSVATRAETFLLNTPLKELKEQLDPDLFWQIHRGVIVNVGAIDKIYRSFRGSLEVKLKDRGEVLPVSAAHSHLFKSV